MRLAQNFRSHSVSFGFGSQRTVKKRPGSKRSRSGMILRPGSISKDTAAPTVVPAPADTFTITLLIAAIVCIAAAPVVPAAVVPTPIVPAAIAHALFQPCFITFFKSLSVIVPVTLITIAVTVAVITIIVSPALITIVVLPIITPLCGNVCSAEEYQADRKCERNTRTLQDPFQVIHKIKLSLRRVFSNRRAAGQKDIISRVFVRSVLKRNPNGIRPCRNTLCKPGSPCRLRGLFGGIARTFGISFYRELFGNSIRKECLIGESTDRSV